MILALALACSPPLPTPTVVVVVMDTVRPDHLGVYGGRATPNVDALAATGVVYERAWASAPWTFPSHGTLFSGLPPESHGCTSATLRCDAAVDLLAERFQAAGYATGGFSNNPWVTGATGLAAGFETYVEPFRTAQGVTTAVARYVDTPTTGLTDAGAARTVGAVDRWLGEQAGKPVFLFVNLIEAHYPYDPPDGWRGRLRGGEVLPAADRSLQDRWFTDAETGTLSDGDLGAGRTLYDEEIAYVDEQVGRLLDSLDRHGRGDAAVVVTADHGEAFGEHHLGQAQLVDHRFSVHDELLRVPLVVRWPGRMGGGVRIAADVGLVDVAPLVLSALDRGDGAAPVLLDPPSDRPLTASYAPPLSELPSPRERAPGAEAALAERTFRVVRRGSAKLIQPSDGPAQLYDLEADPGELHDLAALHPERVATLIPLLPPAPAPAAATPDPTTTGALQALGYLP